jgi:hypothetical protein
VAIEQLQLAPVVTPKTLEEMARILRDRDRHDLAEVVSDLVPVVQETVEDFFEPISQTRSESDFREAFRVNAREFEPYRLYINITLFQILGTQNFFKFYTDVLLRLNERLWAAAHRKHLPARRIKAVLERYFATLAPLLATMMKADTIQGARIPEGLNLFAWVRNLTELDYGLTSLFLIMEDAISTPPESVSNLLVVAAEHSLNTFSDQCRLLTQAISSGRDGVDSGPSSFRAQELEWLAQNERTGGLRNLAGQWIVIEKNQLVAHDWTYDAARDRARQAGIARPFLIFVPRTTEPAFMGI